MSRVTTIAICALIILPSVIPQRATSRNLMDSITPLLRSSEFRSLVNIYSKNPGRSLAEQVAYKCQILHTIYTYWKLSHPEIRNDPMAEKMNLILAECGVSNFRHINIFNRTVVFPGTKWCGQSNIARSYDDLGMFNETDSCCRAHDNCEDSMRPGETKHDLYNPQSTTRLNCECDESLRQCFRNVNSVISNTMGYIFFSLLQTQCFKYEHPAVGCKRWRRGSVRLYCVEYILEKEKQKQWQWFDQEPFF